MSEQEQLNEAAEAFLNGKRVYLTESSSEGETICQCCCDDIFDCFDRKAVYEDVNQRFLGRVCNECAAAIVRVQDGE